MPQMVLGRNFILRTTAGHTLAFKKGESVFVPTHITEEAMKVGAEYSEETDKAAMNAEAPAAPPSPQGEEREKAVFAAFKAMLKSGNREAFNGAGYPNIKILREALGFSDIDAAERNVLWDRFQDTQVPE